MEFALGTVTGILLGAVGVGIPCVFGLKLLIRRLERVEVEYGELHGWATHAEIRAGIANREAGESTGYTDLDDDDDSDLSGG